ncbi:MAG: disulfide bond formation protein DsbA [Comamonadaceae bacterium]|nr:MAG: disulfide bond formation protein DsbA [Comamonadaceae bacterium]
MTNKKLLLLLCGAIVLLGFAFGVYGHFKQKNESLNRLASENNAVFNRTHSPTYGPATAKVRIVEFFDPACETCRAFYPLVKRMVDGYGGKVQLVLRYVPFHEGSDVAVKILEAARLQDERFFWPVTETVLGAQPAWAAHGNPSPEHIWEFLGKTGLDVAKARQDVNRPSIQAVIDQDMADAKTLRVTKTPGFFVNGRPLVDFGHEQLRQLVDEEVRRAYAQ